MPWNHLEMLSFTRDVWTSIFAVGAASFPRLYKLLLRIFDTSAFAALVSTGWPGAPALRELVVASVHLACSSRPFCCCGVAIPLCVVLFKRLLAGRACQPADELSLARARVRLGHEARLRTADKIVYTCRYTRRPRRRRVF